MSITISGNYVDITQRRIYPATIVIVDKKIASVREIAEALPGDSGYILPGFIDSHVHIESSMLIPSEFARLAVVHGTVATVSDPHEIANVCGIEGVEFMIDNGRKVPFRFNFGAPSCVPATVFETAGAVLDARAVASLLQREEIRYLSEMMNFPGLLNEDPEVMQKIAAAHKALKPVDGHAPGLTGEAAKKYIAAGITTDHECFTKEEALDKLQNGMKILIREGSAAKNFEALIELLHEYPNQMMFCSDDKHPDSLVVGHINELCARAVAKGIDVFKVLQAACVNPVLHYHLPVGLLKEGDAADFVLVKDLRKFEVIQTYIDGELVAENGRTLIPSQQSTPINNFKCKKKTPANFHFYTSTANDDSAAQSPRQLFAIEALDGQLITNKWSFTPKVHEGRYISDVENDILKIVVVNRYREAPVAVSFIKNTGLREGAIASSVAHDSHNIVAVGVDDESICKAVNMIIEHQGGVSLVKDNVELMVPLPVAGLMSNEDGYQVAKQYALIDQAAKDAGSSLSSPFMTLSFMALLVIPHLKLSDKGLFDGDSFSFVQR
jgi:adenine deaminase